MLETTNYKLKKPDGNDYVSIGTINENMDVIDTELKNVSNELGGKAASNHNHTPASVGAAASEDHQIKTYSELAQLGLSGAVTLNDVISAMPNGSILILNNNTTATNYVSDPPATYGTLCVVKRQTNYVFAEFFVTASTDSARYYNMYHSTSGWSGWTTGFLPLTGGTLTGTLNLSNALSVPNGGTGAKTFTSGAALIGAGTGAVTTRAITNLTAKGAATASTNLATVNTVVYHSQARLNRTTNVNAADTGYTTYMARAIALVTAAPSSLTNGCCAFVYE